MQFPVTRCQFSITPAEAITIHKSQEQTYNTVCINFIKNKRLTKSMLYVALSRVTKLSVLFILDKFTPPKAKNDDVMQEIIKLKYSKQMQLNYNNLKSINGIVIVYQNVHLLQKKLIKNDSWYNRAHILIFTETLLTKNSTINLQGYKILFKSCKSSNSSGKLCFGKNNISITNIKHINEYKCTDWHVELYSFCIKNVYVITGYKSPKTNINTFGNNLDSILSSLYNSNTIIIIGDFNINFKTNNVLNFLMLKYNLKSLLNNGSTTVLNTEIDIIFGNRHLNAGVYETYFSYRPIFVELNDHNTENIDPKKDKNKTTPIILNLYNNDDLRNNIDVSQIDNIAQKSINIVQSNINSNNTGLISLRKELPQKQYLDQRLIDNDFLTILDSKGYLEDIHIDTFGEIVKNQTKFTPQSTLYVDAPHNIKSIPTFQKNIQILFHIENNWSLDMFLLRWYK